MQTLVETAHTHHDGRQVVVDEHARHATVTPLELQHPRMMSIRVLVGAHFLIGQWYEDLSREKRGAINTKARYGLGKGMYYGAYAYCASACLCIYVIKCLGALECILRQTGLKAKIDARRNYSKKDIPSAQSSHSSYAQPRHARWASGCRPAH